MRLQVGRLGEFDLPAADYVYLGSACGPGGLRARLGRHLSGAGRAHWHIDYLRRVTQVAGCLYRPGRPSLECAWSQTLLLQPEAFIPIPGFGARDCVSGCPAHLIAFPHLAGLVGVLPLQPPAVYESLLNGEPCD